MVLRFLPGLIVLVTGILILTLLIPNGIDDPGFEQPNSLAPDDFPRLLAWAVISLGILLLALDGRHADFAPRAPGPFRAQRAAPFLVALLATVVAIPTIGIEISAFVFTAGMLAMASDVSWRGVLAIATGFVVLIHVLFIRMAGIPIPSSFDILF